MATEDVKDAPAEVVDLTLGSDGEGEEQEEEEEERNWKEDILDALESVGPAGSFAAGGVITGVPSLCPNVAVDGIGRLGLPLSKEQFASLLAVSAPAPHGRGLDTVIDDAVRKARQIIPACVKIAESWSPVLDKVLASALSAFGATAAGVEARLDKLVLYEVGGHFKRHVDSEKEPGMFG